MRSSEVVLICLAFAGWVNAQEVPPQVSDREVTQCLLLMPAGKNWKTIAEPPSQYSKALVQLLVPKRAESRTSSERKVLWLATNGGESYAACTMDYEPCGTTFTLATADHFVLDPIAPVPGVATGFSAVDEWSPGGFDTSFQGCNP